MKIVTQYLETNKAKIAEVFAANSKKNELPATSLHTFLKTIFEIDAIKFIRDGKDYFREDDHQSYTDKIIDKYYKTTPDGKKGKFYLYRITFSFQEIQEYLEYWLTTDKTITVQPPPSSQPPPERIQQPPPSLAETPPEATTVKEAGVLGDSAFLDNEFILDEQKIPLLLESYQNEIIKLQEKLGISQISATESTEIIAAIKLYKKKIEDLKLKKPISKEPEILKAQEKIVITQQKILSPPKSKTETSPTRKQANLKQVFEFYARQNHLTGAKASFQRIEHESQTINYQKLVHFLKEHSIFPQKPKDQKRLHNLYVRVCSNTRDLHYADFMQLIDKLPDILYDSIPSPQNRREMMLTKIEANSHKLSKVEPGQKKLHNPFHSLEKNNFRIDSQNLKYSFKLKPLQGKLEEQVNNELESRRKLKEQVKVQLSKQKEAKHLQKLKKLMAIDPYHPLVLKNADLLQKRSSSVLMQPIASLDNMQIFRDANFDMRAQFGIIDFEEDPLKQISRRYDSRVEQLEREESQRMGILMSGIVQRSEAKIEKFSQSPRKRQVSSKLS